MNINKEELSALVDGEHNSDQVIDQLIHDGGMKQTWSHYHLIGDCLRENLPNQISNQISENISHALRDEPTVLAPSKTKQFNLKPLAGFAIAASVAMVAVFSIQSGNEVGTPSIGSASIATTSPLQSNPVNFSKPELLPAAVSTQSDTPESIANQRLNNYLLNHNEYRSNVGVNGILPYVRMVTIENQE